MADYPIIVDCVNCGDLQYIEMDQFDRGQFHTCKKCQTSFNVYGVYARLYGTIPIAKQLAEALTMEMGANYAMEGGQVSDIGKIETFFKKVKFDSLLKQIVFDTVVFGNSFVEKTSDGFLQRIDPSTVEVSTSPSKGNGYAFVLEIDTLVQHVPEYREIKGSDVIHFSGEYGGHDPLGISIYGFWFHIWRLLRFPPEKSLLEYARSSVVIGSGVPIFKIDASMKVPDFFENNAFTLFKVNVELRRRRIARTVEREVFPIALGRPYKYDDYPYFKF